MFLVPMNSVNFSQLPSRKARGLTSTRSCRDNRVLGLSATYCRDATHADLNLPPCCGSIPTKVRALRHLSRLLYPLDGWYLLWELPIEGDAVEEHVGDVLPIAGAENSSLVNKKLSSRPWGTLARR